MSPPRSAVPPAPCSWPSPRRRSAGSAVSATAWAWRRPRRCSRRRPKASAVDRWNCRIFGSTQPPWKRLRDFMGLQCPNCVFGWRKLEIGKICNSTNHMLVFWRGFQSLSSFLVVYLEPFNSIFWKMFRFFLQVGGFKSEWNMSKGLDLGCASNISTIIGIYLGQWSL